MALNRPEKHNALSFDLLGDIDEAFDTAEADEDRLFLFSGPVCGSSSCFRPAPVRVI